ncbi:GntR family transcriptional regulator [Marinilactibacillus psychrotolerans]|uniref:Arabinose metabolism transcriptional repressor n=1 Tax=Marinilactibacillus psychrotolerans TaxID=191770 RepID=A0AAV3WVS3_9LACT|nr:GntR family transcriptional regulator [Marinilactibacillus psychrotolerans]GEL67355.1 GntR family transcriptional regulator [Marinilactibacillus psychrotolerans]GEQ36298.1 arabinose metabolism transcriptional repressor [Marinilactibacillus psychrotolerans]SDC94333.1 GntR family transcriptional regulator, arabinose operon transcriptional repressor [Marinilactibacillus psychrotolerans]
MLNEPKYIIIKKEIQHKIKEKEYALGTKIPSEAELRKQFDVSRHTIRQAVSELVNEGYLVKQQGSGTFVSDLYQKETISNNKKTIGVITTYLSDYIFPSIIRGIEEELSKLDYSLMLSSTRNNVDNERSSLESMIDQNVDGLIVEPTKSNLMNPNLNYYLNLSERPIPMIMLNASYEELDFPFIALDDVKAGRIATEHLIELNHIDIGIITKADDLQGKNRLKGYIKALYDAKLSFDSNYIIRYDTESKQDLPKMIHALLLSENVPTSFVCYNDEVAVMLIKEINAIGKECPDDFSVVSHDNSFYSTTLPSVKLTSIDHPKENLGRLAAKSIVQAVEDGIPLKSHIFEPKLIIRNSTKNLEENQRSEILN